MSTGISSPTNVIELLNTAEYKELFTEAAINTLGPEDGTAEIEGLFDYLANGTDWRNNEVDTDWNDIIFRDGQQSDVDLAVSGVTSKHNITLEAHGIQQKGYWSAMTWIA